MSTRISSHRPARLRHASRAILVAGALALAPVTARAQSAIVDEGTFLVSRNGSAVGRESFRILRSPGPGGQVLLVTGQSAVGDNRIVTRLGTDAAGVPVSYEANLSVRGEQIQRLQGRGRPGRFSVLVQTKTGESARDYVLSSGALLIDGDVFHQFYFLPQLATHSSIVVIDPSAARQTTFTLTDRGAENVSLSGRSFAARHYALVAPSGSAEEVWVDGTGRLLKVSIPEKGLVAVRED